MGTKKRKKDEAVPQTPATEADPSSPEVEVHPSESKRGFFSRMFGGAEQDRTEEILAELEGLRAHVVALDQQVTTLRAAHAGAVEEKTAAERKVLLMTKHAQTVSKEHADLGRRLGERVAELEAGAAGLLQERDDAREQAARADDKLKAERQRTKTVLRKQGDDAKARERLTERIRELEAAANRAAQTEAKLGEVEVALGHAEDALKKQRDAARRAEQAESKLAALAEQRVADAAAQKALEKRVESLASQLETAQAKRQAIAKDAEEDASKRKALEKVVALRDKDLANLQGLVKHAQAEAKRAKAVGTALEARLSERVRELEAGANRAEQAEAKLGEVEVALGRAEDGLKKHRNATRRAEEAESKLAALTTQRVAEAAAQHALEKRVQALASQLEAAQAERQAMAKDAEDDASRHLALEKAVALRDEDVENLEAILEKAQAEAERARTEGAALEARAQELEAQLEQHAEQSEQTATLRRERDAALSLSRMLGHGTARFLDDLFGAESALAWQRWGEGVSDLRPSEDVLASGLAGFGAALLRENGGVALRLQRGESDELDREHLASWLSTVAACALAREDGAWAPAEARRGSDGTYTVPLARRDD